MGFLSQMVEEKWVSRISNAARHSEMCCGVPDTGRHPRSHVFYNAPQITEKKRVRCGSPTDHVRWVGQERGAQQARSCIWVPVSKYIPVDKLPGALCLSAPMYGQQDIAHATVPFCRARSSATATVPHDALAPSHLSYGVLQRRGPLHERSYGARLPGSGGRRTPRIQPTLN